jgi:hypothetical protein
MDRNSAVDPAPTGSILNSIQPLGPDGLKHHEATTEDQSLLDAVFNTSTLGLHVLESIRDERGNIRDFYIRSPIKCRKRWPAER